MNNHYKQGSIEPIDFIIAQKMNFLEGNIIKYVARYKYKNGVEDLEKAKVYLQRLIDEKNNYYIIKGRKLNSAIINKDLNKIAELITEGADVNFNIKEGFGCGLPLQKAIMVASPDIVKYLIEQGADINCKIDNEPVLCYAISLRDYYIRQKCDNITIESMNKIIDLLINAGAKE